MFTKTGNLEKNGDSIFWISAQGLLSSSSSSSSTVPGGSAIASDVQGF